MGDFADRKSIRESYFPDTRSKYPDPLSREFAEEGVWKRGLFRLGEAAKVLRMRDVPCIFPDDQGILPPRSDR